MALEIDHKAWARAGNLLSEPELARLTNTENDVWSAARARGDGPPYVITATGPRYGRASTEIWLIERSIAAGRGEGA